MAGKQNTLSKFMLVLSSVEGFPLTHEALQQFAYKIPADTGVKPTKSRDKPRAKTVYNKWCAKYWKAFCEAEYGRTLPLADLKYGVGENKGQVKVSAQTGIRRDMWTEFQKTEDFQTLQLEVDSENEKLGNTPSKKKETQTQMIQRLTLELEETKRKAQSSKLNEEPPLPEFHEEPDTVSPTKNLSEFDQMDTNGDGVVDRSEFEAHLKQKQNDTVDEQTQWAITTFGGKSSETTCFKAWIMVNHHDKYGPQKKDRISSDELAEFKAQHDWKNHCGDNYTDQAPWFQFIPVM